jgi:hypothetical protein
MSAADGKPFSDGEFFRKYSQRIAEEIFPQRETVLNTVNFPCATMTQ